MMSELSPYEQYKDSGQPWLGKVPAHWDVVRIKRVLREVDRRSKDGSETLLSLSRTRGLIRQSEMTSKATTAATLEGYKLYEPGQVVMNRMQAWSGMFGVGTEAGLVSPDYAVFQPLANANPEFLLHLLRSPRIVSQFAIGSKGIGTGFNRLYTEDFGTIFMPLPPPDEQSAIVRFLGALDRRVNRFVRAKRRLIELLTEQKQAIITHAVTRGLNPNVKLKPSGFDFIRDVPEHWTVTKLSRLTFFQEGPGLRTWQFTEAGIQVICVTNIKAEGVDLSAYGRFISPDEFRGKYQHFKVERGDLLLASSGNSWGKIGEYRAEQTVMLNTSTIRLNPARHGKVTNGYLKLILGSEHVRLQLQALLTGSCQPNFGPSHLNRVVASYPPELAEQEAITASVTDRIRPFDAAVSRAEREIALIREYRTRLVADVVTGKLDVRAAAARLPDDELAADADLSETPDAADDPETEAVDADEAEAVQAAE